jgi:hypothetical protein
MFRTRQRVIALVIASLLSIGTAVKLNRGEAPSVNRPAAEETRTSAEPEPAPELPMPPTWALSDFSWM